MGRACPFASDELVFTTSAPVFTADECVAVREEAAALMGDDDARVTFAVTGTNRDVALHDLPETVAWLNEGALARVASLAAACFPGAVDDATSLWVYRGLVAKYDAAAGLTHQPMHRDGALISVVVPLSERAAYEGGGTFVEPLGRAIALEQGHALLHPSAVRHAGHRITAGERWVIAIFLNVETMCYCEHGRRFRARAQECFVQQQLESELDAMVAEALEAEEVDLGSAADHGKSNESPREVRSFRQLTGRGARRRNRLPPGDDHADFAEEHELHAHFAGDYEFGGDEELECLLHALEVTGGADHEVFFDLGARAHERGDLAEALSMYERAVKINPDDALVLGNLGATLRSLGRLREAFRCYRRALAADENDANARYSAGELLLADGRSCVLRALADLLAAAPGEVSRDEGLQALARELHARSTHS